MSEAAAAARECADDLASALAETGWRPIATVPINQPVWIGHALSQTMLICWRETPGSPWTIIWSNKRVVDWEPTHWMPLPPPPAEEPGR
jgi:hypothetical protein